MFYQQYAQRNTGSPERHSTSHGRARLCHGFPTQQPSVFPSKEEALPPIPASRERRNVTSRGWVAFVPGMAGISSNFRNLEAFSGDFWLCTLFSVSFFFVFCRPFMRPCAHSNAWVCLMARCVFWCCMGVNEVSHFIVAVSSAGCRHTIPGTRCSAPVRRRTSRC